MHNLNWEIQKLSKIWKDLKICWYINILKNSYKTLNYTPVWKELSFQEDSNCKIIINIIDNLKKITIKTNIISYDHIKNEIKKNLDLLNFSTSNKNIYLPQIKDIKNIDNSQFNLNSVDWEFLLKQWNKVNNFKYNKNISIEWFSYSLEKNESIFINSFNSFKTYKNTCCSYALELFYNSKLYSNAYYESKYTSKKENINDRFISDLQKELILKSDPKKPTLLSWIYNITFQNKLALEFIKIFLTHLLWEKINQKQSIFSIYDLNKKIISDKITIISDSNVLNSPFNKLFDSEGFNINKLCLIDKWYLKNIFLDSKNAKILQLKNTWNSTYSNIQINWKFEKNYLKDSKFLFTELKWLHTIDNITWKFAFEWEWFEINNWKIWNFIKNININWNIKNLFENIISIWDDIYNYSNIFTPSITFKNQNIIL